MKKALWIFPWVVLLVPFVVLSLFYDSISQEILTYRSLGGDEIQYAPKSLFTVFRVPLIEAVCAATIVIMRRKTSEFNSEFRTGYYSMWSVLLFTVALKSLFQTFEFVSTSIFSQPFYASVFFYATLAIVVGGIILAFVKGKKIFANFQSESWRLKNWEKISLTIFFLIYLSLAFAPMLIYS
jgi:uncharacterized membrane protein